MSMVTEFDLLAAIRSVEELVKENQNRINEHEACLEGILSQLKELKELKELIKGKK